MFYSDQPIESNYEDQLGRASFAKLLAQSFLNLYNQDTFSVGLFGKWGSGKTSVANMMLNELEKRQTEVDEERRFVVVRFEPWNITDSNQLLSQFLIRLSNEFRSNADKNLAQIGEALEKYSDAFELTKAIPGIGELLAVIGKKSADAIGKKLKNGSDEKDITKQKELIIDLLRKQSKRILVVIDDIDRLSNEQIRQVFQLVASVAKFPNTIYLLIFDKDIVVKALESVQEGNGLEYLEKVIQVPIRIPDVQRSKLREVLIMQLYSIISEYEEISFNKMHWQRLFESCIDPFIVNIRDINRLCNAVQFKLAAMSSEVDFTDLVALSVLEISIPEVYDWIKSHKAVLTGALDYSSIGRRDKLQKEWYDSYYAEIQELLSARTNAEKNRDHTDIVITSLSFLFPYFGQKIGKLYEAFDISELRRNNQIGHPEKFDRYFNLDLDTIAIKKSEIMQAVHTFTVDELIAYLFQIDTVNNSYEFVEEIRAMIPELSSERAKVVSTALIESSTSLNGHSSRSFLSLNTSKFANVVALDLLDVVNSEERFSFLSELLQNAEIFSIAVLADIINMIELAYGRLGAEGRLHNYTKPITLDELIQIESVFTNRVKELLQQHEMFDFMDWQIVFYLLECYDSEYAKSYLTKAFVDDANIVKYLECSVGIWIGGLTKYEIKEEYKKYLTVEQILKAIQSTRDSGSLFAMPEKIQNICGAFFLWASEENSSQDEISQIAVNQLLDTWKKQYFAK